MAAVTVPPLFFVSRFPSIRPVLVALLLVLAAYAVAGPSSAAAADSGFGSAEVTAAHFFEPLEHNIVDVAGAFADGTPFTAIFLDNLTRTGGIERWGYPTSAVFEESPGTLTQYYQRGVVDWQPPPGGGAHSFQRRLAWDYLGGGLGGSTDLGVELHLTNPNPGEKIGPWGHKVSNTSVEGVPIGFAGFFHRLGGVASFGFPKTDARRDDHPQAELHTPGRPVDGRIRQYFQSAVLEYHPESPGSPVKLSLLGDTLRDHRYPRRAWQQYLAFGPEAPLAVGDHLELRSARRGPAGATAEELAQFLELSLLRVQTDRACGSGFFVREDGYAVTTWNLVNDATTIWVESPRGYSLPAHLVAGDQKADIALLKVSGDDHIPVSWEDSGNLAEGDQLLAVGYDARLVETGRGVECQSVPTATPVSVLDLEIPLLPVVFPAISAGRSGGPVALATGRVVGMTATGYPHVVNPDTFAPSSRIQSLISSWIANVDRGQSSTIPLRPEFDRTVLFESANEACSSTSRPIQYSASRIEVSTNASLNSGSSSFYIEIARIAFRDFDDGLVPDEFTITLGSVGLSSGSTGLKVVRRMMDDYTVLRRESHADVVSGQPFHVRFNYNAGALALYINGNAVLLDDGIPYGEYVTLTLSCFGSGDRVTFSDLSVIGTRVTTRELERERRNATG